MNEHNTNSPYSPAYPGLPKITVEDVEPLLQEKRKSNLKKKSLDAARSYSLMLENEGIEVARFLSTPDASGLLKRPEDPRLERRRSSLIKSGVAVFFGNEHHVALDAPLFKERFPGCWILGHGTIVNMSIEFSNAYLVSQFIGRLVKMHLGFCASRVSFILLTVLTPSLHTFLYTNDHKWFPFGISFLMFFIMIGIINMNVTEKYIRLTPINVVVLILTEISLTFLLMFLSLFAELSIQKWYISLDLFQDLEHDGFEPYELNYWPNIHLTPALFVAIAHLQIMVNLITIYIMNLYTKIHFTSRMVYYVIIFQTIFTTAFAIVIMKDNSYGVSYLWDNLQLFMATTWTICTSFLYIHYINRLVDGKMISLTGMTWHDLVLGTLKVSYL